MKQYLKKTSINQFEIEERSMRQYNYPDYVVHKAKHQIFIDTLNNFGSLKQKFDTESFY